MARGEFLEPRVAWAATGLCCVYYLFLLTNGDFRLFAPETLGPVFDHMAWNLLHWRFTIDREVIGQEAFLWRGGTYSYFAIFPALLRLPMVLAYDADPPSLSRLSCWAGLCVIAAASTSVLLRARTLMPATPMRDPAIALALAATLLAGPLLALTFTAWIYNEPIVWGTAMAMLFLRLLLDQAADPCRPAGLPWLGMGALAGLGFSVRPIPAVAMTLALGLAVPFLTRATPQAPRLAAMVRAAGWAGLGFLPLLAAALLVNWERWGDPLEFAPLTAGVFIAADPRRMRIALETGAFDLRRLPLGIAYYLFGMNNGWTAAAADRLSDGLGWPRSPLLATAATQIAMGLLACVAGARYGLPAALRGAAGLCLLAMPAAMAAMVLILIYMNYRYRLEFLPLLLLCSLAGAAALAAMPPAAGRRAVVVLGLLLAGNVAVAHLDLLQAKLASFAQPEDVRNRIARATWPLSGLFATAPAGN